MSLLISSWKARNSCGSAVTKSRRVWPGNGTTTDCRPFHARQRINRQNTNNLISLASFNVGQSQTKQTQIRRHRTHSDCWPSPRHREEETHNINRDNRNNPYINLASVFVGQSQTMQTQIRHHRTHSDFRPSHAAVRNWQRTLTGTTQITHKSLEFKVKQCRPSSDAADQHVISVCIHQYTKTLELINK